MRVSIDRLDDDGAATLGLLSVDSVRLCFTLEDTWHAVKIPGRTRIPPGVYPIIPIFRGKFFSAYNKRWGHKFALGLKDVPDFTNIMLHTGLVHGHTEGCPLVAYSASVKGHTAELVSGTTRPAYAALYEHLEPPLLRGRPVLCHINDFDQRYT